MANFLAAAAGAAVALLVSEVRRKKLQSSEAPPEDSPQAAAASKPTLKKLQSIRRVHPSCSLRNVNVDLMERGHAAKARQAKAFGPQQTQVVRIALTGGPCAGKSSALSHLCREATEEGFDVITAPEVATLYLNSGYRFPEADEDDFAEKAFAFQVGILKLQLQMERCLTTIAASTGRPTIVVFDRGMLDGKSYIDQAQWERALAELDEELGMGRPKGAISEEYILARYAGVIHLVTAADGAPQFYKGGQTTDDSGREVNRRETAEEAIASDKRLRSVWAAHPKHKVVKNVSTFAEKLATATEAVLEIAREAHPAEWEEAKVRKFNSGKSLSSGSAQSSPMNSPTAQVTVQAYLE